VKEAKIQNADILLNELNKTNLWITCVDPKWIKKFLYDNQSAMVWIRAATAATQNDVDELNFHLSLVVVVVGSRELISIWGANEIFLLVQVAHHWAPYARKAKNVQYSVNVQTKLELSVIEILSSF
jgi:hypothetical protein